MNAEQQPRQFSDEVLLGLLRQHGLVSASLGWKAEPNDPFNAGVKVSPNCPVVNPIPPCDGKLALLALMGGAVRGGHTLEKMASGDYLQLDSSQLVSPNGPSGHIYVSFQPGQVPNVPNGKNDPFVFMVELIGAGLPPTLELVLQTPSNPKGVPLMLKDVSGGLYCGVIPWNSGRIEISGPSWKPVEFHWAELRRLHAAKKSA